MAAMRLVSILGIALALTGCEEPPGTSVAIPVATAPSRTASLAAGDQAAWADVPLSRLPPNPFGSIETWQAFVRALRTPEFPLTVCSQGWRPPAGFATLDLETELRVRASDGFLVVEDMIVLGGNVGDPEFEACLVRQYTGRRAPAPAVEPGRAFRIAWGIRKHLE